MLKLFANLSTLSNLQELLTTSRLVHLVCLFKIRVRVFLTGRALAYLEPGKKSKWVSEFLVFSTLGGDFSTLEAGKQVILLSVIFVFIDLVGLITGLAL